MFLRANYRKENGSQHRYWSIVETVRTGTRVYQRPVLYLGELNDAQHDGWRKTIDVIDGHKTRQMSLFAADNAEAVAPNNVNEIHVQLEQMTLQNSRQWGGCWLAMELWRRLDLDKFWGARLLPSRKGTSWLNVLKTLTAYCLQATLKNIATYSANGLTPRAILDKFKKISMVDVHFPTSDGRELVMPRYVEPTNDLQLLLSQLHLELPAQPPPKIYRK